MWENQRVLLSFCLSPTSWAVFNFLKTGRFKCSEIKIGYYRLFRTSAVDTTRRVLNICGSKNVVHYSEGMDITVCQGGGGEGPGVLC